MTYTEHFQKIVEDQLARVEKLKNSSPVPDFAAKEKIIIGTIDGDGIGPVIMDSCRAILEKLLADDIASGKIELRKIEGLTIENRIAKMETVPADVLAAIKECDLLLKGPTTTPGKGDNLPNIESANVTLRRELDLFANVRPVVIPEKNIDWIFYRENTEGEYALGSRGVEINDDISIDFKVTTTIGTTRLAKAAFEYAKNNGNKNVSIVTKANIMKKTDGKFLSLCYDVARDYPQIKTDDWYVDIMAANLVKIRSTATSTYSSCRIYTATSSPMKRLSCRAAWAQREAPTSAADMLCSKRSTAPRLVWWKTVSQNTPIRPASTARLS